MTHRWSFIRSFVCFLLFLELFFWIGGWITQATQYWENVFLAQKKGVYRIICIGESTTFDGGKDSYPSQLEAILNANSNGKRFQVINQGVPGATSTIILHHLNQWLDTYQPDMVIAMVGINDSDDANTGVSERRSFFLEKSKLYQLSLQLKLKAIKAFNEYIQKEKDLFLPNNPQKTKQIETEYDMFEDALKQQSNDQKRLYILIQIAQGVAHDDVVQALFEKFLDKNTNVVIHNWVIKEYGAYLMKIGSYDKFLTLMPEIPYDAWQLKLVNDYCHSEQHMEDLRYVIENMIYPKGHDPAVYGYLASCYEEGDRPDMAAFYFNKIGIKNNYYYKTTRENYLTIKDILLSRDIQAVFVQYPMRSLGSLMSIFENEVGKERIIFVDNGSIFQEAVRKSSYEANFVDRAAGDFGHATAEGNHLLAANIAKTILKKWGNN